MIKPVATMPVNATKNMTSPINSNFVASDGFLVRKEKKNK
jgi:hypothetical protein